MSLKLSDLKLLHDKGLALIYLKPKSKRPFENGWTTQDAKTWDELEASFEKTYNVGVRLGKPSKLKTGNYLGAIDCDVKSKSRKAIGEMNAKLRALGIDLLAAPIVMSGRGNGSRHVYVQTANPMQPCKFATSEHKVKVHMPGETRPHTKVEMKRLSDEERKQGWRIRPAWEISFMGTGQQTVLPPSIHPDSGMAYDWASPLNVKYTPLFKPEKFTAQRQASGVKSAGDGRLEFDFKAVDVDLWASKLHPTLIHIIIDGKGCEDRSASLMTIAMSMCRLGFTDNEILSVLSNPDHWISGAAYDRRRGRRSAVEWLYRHTLLKARHETSVMRYFDNPPTMEEARPVGKKLAKKTATLIEDEINLQLPDRDGKGNPKPTVRNIVHILEHFMGEGLVGYDEFSNRAVFLQDTVYGGKKGAELSDHDDLQLLHHIACHYNFEPSSDHCFKAHALISKRYKFHPVRNYLESIEWDGKPRLDDWLKIAFMATSPRDYLRAISRKVLVAAVKRVYEPGCKFDYMLVLEGFQGKGKSMALGALAGREWFTDSLGNIHEKDVVDQMTGKWVIEMAELASIRKIEIEPVKAFISRQVDRVRPPYGRRSVDFPRQSIFVGSTNISEYFHDETGNRRFWPVNITAVNQRWIADNRDQLWAEAKVRYDLGEDVYLSPVLEEVAQAEQEKRFEVDEWEAELKRVVSKGDEPFITTELWRAINLTSGNGHPTMMDSKRIGKVMVRLGFIRTVRRIDGALGKCWVKNTMMEGK